MSSPLAGVRVVEFAGLGPGPFCAMLLADLGAEVVRIERPGADGGFFDPAMDVLLRGRHATLTLDLKLPAGRDAALAQLHDADGLIEGFRPGVMERLGLGPDACLAANPRLVYGRITGWGQSGPLAASVGHDLNYVALSGVLDAIGRAEGGPVPPLNLVADFGAGAMLLAVGLLAALLDVQRTGRGQVVDAAMCDGLALFQAMTLTLRAMGQWQTQRQSNLLDGGAPRYDTYKCSDGRFLAIAALEPAFYRALLDGLGLADDALMRHPDDRTRWPAQKERIACVIAGRTRDEWAVAFEHCDACVTPVLTLEEAMRHPHHRARGNFVEVDGVVQPAAAPRFARPQVM